METGPAGLTRLRLARRLIAPWLGPDEAAHVVRDLESLRQRGGRGALWFWRSVAGYPVRTVWEGVRVTLGYDLGRGRGRMDGVRGDIGYALRGLWARPGFAVTAVVILAVAMGAGTAIYSVVRGVLLDPLPYAEAEALHAVWLEHDEFGRARMTPGNFTDLGTLDAFSSVAAFSPTSAALEIDGDATYVQGGRVTPDYFRTLGIPLTLGRTFTEAEAADGPQHVVLGHGLWQRAFGADPDIVGRTVRFNQTSFTVVGVAGPGLYPTTVLVSAELPFTGTSQDFFIPLTYSSEGWQNRRSHVLGTIARRAEGVSLTAASESLEALGARLRASEPLNASESFTLTPLEEEITGDVRLALILLLVAVGLVLTIAVANVGALFVLRGDDRSGDVEIRLALGAPWSRVLRQLVVESSIVVAAAGGLALAVAAGAIEGMKRAVPYQIPRMESVGLDAGAMVLAFVLAAALALGFGTAPAWRLVRDLGPKVRRTATAGVGQRRLQGGVVLLQSGLGVVVLVGAVLLARSFAALQATDPGFDAPESWVFDIRGLGIDGDVLVDEVRGIPGVAAAALTYDHPLERNWGDGFELPGRAVDPEISIVGSLRPFSAGYFEAAGIAVVAGVMPTAGEFAGETRFAVVNESFREAYFAGDDPVGSVVAVPTARRMMGEDLGDYVIAAVVADVRFLGPERGSEPAVYLPRDHFAVGWSSLIVRPETPDLLVAGPVADVVRRVSPGAAIQSATRLGDLLDAALARPRFNMTLLVAFGVMGLVLSGLGAYGLVGRVVTRRTREIGIRRALGARPAGLARLVMGQALWPMAVGVAIGLVAAWAMSGTVASLLYQVVPGDPLSFVLSAVFMLLVGAAAAFLPTLRALRVDPAGTLREE